MNEADWQFYRNIYPILTEEEWEALPGASGYGTIWWQINLASPGPQMTARVYFVKLPNSYNIGIEVRHQRHGFAHQKLGEISKDELWPLVAQHMPRLEAEVLEDYYKWRKEIDATYK